MSEIADKAEKGGVKTTSNVLFIFFFNTFPYRITDDEFYNERRRSGKI